MRSKGFFFEKGRLVLGTFERHAATLPNFSVGLNKVLWWSAAERTTCCGERRVTL